MDFIAKLLGLAGFGWFTLNLLFLCALCIRQTTRESASQNARYYVGHLLISLAAMWLGAMLL